VKAEAKAKTKTKRHYSTGINYDHQLRSSKYFHRNGHWRVDEFEEKKSFINLALGCKTTKRVGDEAITTTTTTATIERRQSSPVFPRNCSGQEQKRNLVARDAASKTFLP
jgi:hypothetical protein